MSGLTMPFARIGPSAASGHPQGLAKMDLAEMDLDSVVRS